MSRSPVIVWLRNDLRVRDHGALHAACESGAPVLPVYVWSPEDEGEWAPGAASRYWLHFALEHLAAELAERGSRLLIERGPAPPTLLGLARPTGATAVYWNRRYEPAAASIEERIERDLAAAGIDSHVSTGNSRSCTPIAKTRGLPFASYCW